MRWAALFGDLEGQLAAASQLSLESEISERARMDQSAVGLADRLRGQLGGSLKARLSSGMEIDGRLVHVGSEWIVLENGPGSTLIPINSAVVFRGLKRSTSMKRSTSDSRLKLTSALRALSRDRALLCLHLRGGGGESAVTGMIDLVGSDFIEFAVVPSGEYRRARNVAEVLTVPIYAVDALVSQ